MDAIMNFLGNTWVMVGMGVALVATLAIYVASPKESKGVASAPA